MSWSKQKNQQKLNTLYGVDFPDALFWLHEFIVEHPNDADLPNLYSLGINLAGPLKLLLDYDDVSEATFVKDVLLHYRYYRDVPELFTCLLGDSDGEHWGILLDEPKKGFRGAAAYYNNDGDTIRVAQGLFDALLKECEGCIESLAEEIDYIQACVAEATIVEQREEYRQYLAEFTANIEAIQQTKCQLENFLRSNSLSRYEGRPIGLETNTGLDIILPDNFEPQVHEEAISLLKMGRELWYWGGKSKSEEAFNLMRQAYKTLGRYELIRVLEAHFSYRDIPWVDLLWQFAA